MSERGMPCRAPAPGPAPPRPVFGGEIRISPHSETLYIPNPKQPCRPHHHGTARHRTAPHSAAGPAAGPPPSRRVSRRVGPYRPSRAKPARDGGWGLCTFV